MRNDARRTLGLLLLGYLPLAVLVVWGLDRSLAQTSERLTEGTARLLARELATSLDDDLLARMFAPPAQSVPSQERGIQELLARSSAVVAVSAVAMDGEVLAADNTAREGQRQTAYESRFAGSSAPGEPSAVTLQADGRARVAVPAMRDAEPVGYLDLTLLLDAESAPHRLARRRAMLMLSAALATVGILAFLLQARAARVERQLVRSMEEAATGRFDSVPKSPHFSRALAAVGRLGEELRTERDRTRRLASLAEFLDVGVLVVDAAGEVELVSERCRRLLDAEAGTGDSETFRLVSWNDLRAQLAPAMRLLADRPPGASQEVVVELEGGPPRRTRQVQVVALDQDEGFLCLVRDRDLLESLKTDLRLAAYLRGLTRLYMGIAHDLKGPLNAVNLQLEVLRLSALREVAGEQAQSAIERPIETIRSELERLRRMIEGLLSQTAPPSDRLERLDLAELLEDIEGMLAPQARRQGVTLTVAAAGRPLLLRSHRDQLKQAILNVAINGLEVLEEGGSLRLETRREGDRFQVRIRDTGPGIDPEVRDRLFEMHVTTKETGTGIGLWVVRNTLEARGGSIEVEATGPGGTTFLLEIPAHETDQGLRAVSDG